MLVIIVLLTVSFVLHQPNKTYFKQVLRLQDRISDPKFKIKGSTEKSRKIIYLSANKNIAKGICSAEEV